MPTVADIVQSRKITTGIEEASWDWGEARFRLVDVGGQRNYRAKWLHAFDAVSALLFIVALSEFDQVRTHRCSLALSLADVARGREREPYARVATTV